MLDVTKLPDFHYLSYSQACQLGTFYDQEDHQKEDDPLWLQVPDFYLPSKNIMHAVEEDPDFISDAVKVNTLSEMIGVPVDDIIAYVHQKETKMEQKAGRKEGLKEYRDDLGLLTSAEIRKRLKEFQVKLAREQHSKLDLLHILKSTLDKLGISISEFMEEYECHK